MKKKITSALLAILLLATLLAPVSLASAETPATLNVVFGGSATGSANISAGSVNQSFSSGGSVGFTYTGSYNISVTASPSGDSVLSSITVQTASGSNTYYTSTVNTTGTGDCTITINFDPVAPAVYYLTANQVTGGTISVSKDQAAKGESVTVTATAGNGYVFAGWTSDGGSFASATAPQTTFTMPGDDVVITATFDKVYRVKFTASQGGSVSLQSGDVAEGEVINLSAKANDGYEFDEWVSSGSGTFADKNAMETTFVMPAADVTLTATFKKTGGEASDLFAITLQPGEGGQIIVNQNKAAAGKKITVRATPLEGYEFVGWGSLGGGTFEDTASATTSFTMPESDVTLVAEFKLSGAGTPDDNEGGGLTWLWILLGVVALLGGTALVLFILERNNKINLFGKKKKRKPSSGSRPQASGNTYTNSDASQPQNNAAAPYVSGITGTFDFPAPQPENRPAQPQDNADYDPDNYKPEIFRNGGFDIFGDGGPKTGEGKTDDIDWRELDDPWKK